MAEPIVDHPGGEVARPVPGRPGSLVRMDVERLGRPPTAVDGAP
ncbi:hypothetical protein O4J56_23665 [Nocardiopsis sp. RSe5-2]|uniref:Uncharacterized protein n=1 Tax=Nocardiopsis endophytica TaxID=3018445 RepID=A0ABT4U9M6_9ACTN|nr:hypothetical protein [Nocardiopsis endophytica]MDA2813662.1 hypothetical protein [Nocardiopsis endophytica]